MAYATVDELRQIWPGLPVDQEERATALLEDAAVRIDAYAPILTADPIELADALAIRKTISREMVMFLMASDITPGSPVETQISMGPFSKSFDVPKSGRTLMLTADHKAMLRSRRQAAFSIEMATVTTPDVPWWLL